MGNINPLLEFNIKPSKRARLFYTVKIFNNQQDMKQYAAKDRKKLFRVALSSGCGGACTTWYNDSNKYQCGEVLLIKDHLELRVVTHEITHAMFGLKRRKGIVDLAPESIKNEEWCVDAVGLMLAQVFYNIDKNSIVLEY